MNTATFVDRRPVSRAAFHLLSDYQSQVFSPIGLGEADLGQCLLVLESSLKDVCSFVSGVGWSEGSTVPKGFPKDFPTWGWPAAIEQDKVLVLDDLKSPPSLRSGFYNPRTFWCNLEAPAVNGNNDHFGVSTATNSSSPDGYWLMPRGVGVYALASQASVKVVAGDPVVSAFSSDLPGIREEVIPAGILRALQRIRELPDNWDGDGATRIEEETLSRATRLIREACRVAPHDLKPPSVAPAFGGMIVAEWSGPGGRELILDIPPLGEVPGFLLVEPSGEGDEIETDAELAPPWTMRQLIARLTGE